MDVKDVLDEQGIEYTERGPDYLVRCLNPNHDDYHPSLSIDRTTGTAHCFSCDWKTNIFRHFGLDVNVIDIRVKRLKDKILKIQREGIEVPIPLGAEYIHEKYRGISKEIMEEFKAFKTETPEELAHRIIWPVFSISGELKYLHGRLNLTKQGAKYLNYPKGSEKILFPQKVDRDYIVVVEGIIDMLVLRSSSIEAVCTFGSSLISDKDIGNQKLIKKFSNFKLQGVNKVYILFDNDQAGIEGAKKIKKGLDNNYIVEILKLPKDINDPAELSNKQIENIKKEYNL